MTDKITINENRLFEAVEKYFGSLEGAITKALQNACRSCQDQIVAGEEPEIRIAVNENSFEIEDPGHGIPNISKALSLAESEWDEAVLKEQHPAGMGLCALLAHSDALEVQSNFGLLRIDSKRFFRDPEYREELPRLVQDTPADGCRIRMEGVDGTAISGFLHNNAGWYQHVRITLEGELAAPVKDTFSRFEVIGHVRGLPVWGPKHKMGTDHVSVTTLWFGQLVGQAPVCCSDALIIQVDPTHPAPEGFDPVLPDRREMRDTKIYQEIIEEARQLIRDIYISTALDDFKRMVLNGGCSSACVSFSRLQCVRQAIYDTYGYYQVVRMLPINSSVVHREWTNQAGRLFVMYENYLTVMGGSRSLDFEGGSECAYIKAEGLQVPLWRGELLPKKHNVEVCDVQFRLTVPAKEIVLYLNTADLHVLQHSRLKAARLEVVLCDTDEAVDVIENPDVLWYDHSSGVMYGAGTDEWLKWAAPECVVEVVDATAEIDDDISVDSMRGCVTEAASELLNEFCDYIVFSAFDCSFPFKWALGDRITIDTKTNTIEVVGDNGKQTYKY